MSANHIGATTCASHRRYRSPIPLDEIAQPCLLHHSMIMRSPSFGDRPFSTVSNYGYKFHEQQSLKSVNVPLNHHQNGGMLLRAVSPPRALKLRKHRGSSNHRAGKCLLCLLISATFVFAVFLAFLIGHWASNAFVEQIIQYSTTINDERVHAPTIFDVYPPADDDDDADLLKVRLHKFTARRDDALPVGANRHDSTVPLPKSVLPKHYDLELDFSTLESQEEIRGNVTIRLWSFGNATSFELVFHAAANIFINRVRLHKYQSAKFLGIKSVTRDLQQDLVRVSLNERLESDREYILEIWYRARICQRTTSTESSDTILENGAHCFRVTLLDRDNRTFITRITGLVTRFEPRLARTFLPCWDEPRVKATFNASIVHDAHFTMILSNAATIARHNYGSVEMDDASERKKLICTQFAMTPKMSVYLLAFAIGSFTPLELRIPSSNMPLTIWAEPENIVAVHFAANFLPVIFERIQSDFAVKYSMEKLDFVVVPSFPVGGMENWGLVVFHARYLLSTSLPVPPNSAMSSAGSSEGISARLANNLAVDRASEEYKIEKIIAHEIIHQWFGNLVTMYDWNQLWLKEGFTSYFVFDFLNEAHPQLTEYEYYENLINLLNKQSSVAPQALVRDASQARLCDAALFDGLALYAKGAVVVKMLKDLVGTRVFHESIRRFIRKFSFESVDEQALWSSLPAEVDHGAERVSLANAMHSWLYNNGLPEVLITRNYEDQSIRIAQQPANLNRYVIFLSDGFQHFEGSLRHRRENYPDESGDNGNVEGSNARLIINKKISATVHDNPELKNPSSKNSDCLYKNETSMENLKPRRAICITRNDTVSNGIHGPMSTLNYSKLKNSVAKKSNEKSGKKHILQPEANNKTLAKWFNHAILSTKKSEELIRSSSTARNQMNDASLSGSTFDDSFFFTTTTIYSTSLRGTKRKYVKKHRKNVQTKRRYGKAMFSRSRNLKQLLVHNSSALRQLETFDSGSKKLQKNAALPHADLGRVSVFSGDMRKQLRLLGKRVKSDGYTHAGMSTEWEGGATARRLASVQTFGGAVVAHNLTEGRKNAQTHARAVKSAQDFSSRDRSLWWIPFSYAFGSARSTNGQTIRQFWMRNQTIRFVDVGLSSGQYFLANPHWIFSYRVNYDVRNWLMIIEQLHASPNDVPVMSRVQLLVDGEAYLSQSATSHLYVYLLSYLANETELGVLLVGMDRVYAFLDTFGGTRIAGELAAHLLPVVRQLDSRLTVSAAGATPPDTAALWLLGRLRLAKLYQLRCLVNLGSCAEAHQVSKWLAHPTALDAEQHQQITAICHHLYTQAGAGELSLLAGLLRQKSTQLSVLIQLATCVRDDTILEAAVAQILRTRNAAVYLSALRSGYSLQYNRRFRELFWAGVARLESHERRLLFVHDRSDGVARRMLHATRTPDELARVVALIDGAAEGAWPQRLRVQIEYLQRKLAWLHGRASDQLHTFMLTGLNLSSEPDIGR